MLWKYMLSKELIARRKGPEIHVPVIVVLRVGCGQDALPSIQWDDCCPTVLPSCQGVIINRLKRKGIFSIGRREEAGLVIYMDVIEAMRP